MPKEHRDDILCVKLDDDEVKLIKRRRHCTRIFEKNLKT